MPKFIKKITKSIRKALGGDTGGRNVEQDAQEQIAQLIADKNADDAISQQGDQKLYRFEVNGQFDYDLYKDVQILANAAKIGNQWAPEEHIALLADHLNASGHKVTQGICHGTRRGNEQIWFRQHLDGEPDVFGTEIADTAAQFPHTVQWDFHDPNPLWDGVMDMVYSNSWDHSYDPPKAFRTWMESLRPGGVLLLDHGWNYEPDRVNPMDPFGISETGLIDLIGHHCDDLGKVETVLVGGKHQDLQIRTIVIRRHTGDATALS